MRPEVEIMDVISGFIRYTGEPNRREDLAAFGLVKPGDHAGVKTANITIAGQQREIRVSASISDGMTFLRPVKVDFRRAVRELAGITSLRPLRIRS